jgi:DNA (cytosine-5)-methyltransferase 1
MKNSKRIVSKIQKNVQKEIVLVSKNRERKWQLVNFCEFDKYATKSYCAIHGVDESLNLGDITKVDETKLKPFNMICGGSPCQDFSIAGKQKGSVWTCKECGHEYNPLTVHWLKRDKCPCCGSNNIEKNSFISFSRVFKSNKSEQTQFWFV